MENIQTHIGGNGVDFNYTYNGDCPSGQFFKHFHDNYELLFVIDVDGEYVIENHKYTLAPYDILLIKPTKYHYMVLKDHSVYSRIVINISSEYLPEELIANAFKNGEFFHLGSVSGISHNFMKLIEYQHTFNKPDFLLLLKSILIENLLLLQKLDSSYIAEDYRYLDEFNSKVMHYIRDNLTNITSLEQMANDLYVSKSTLYHSFKKAMKISIMQYVRNKKVLYAQSLIKSGMRPTKAYTMSGFEDYTTFYRSYKMFFGHSPNDTQASESHDILDDNATGTTY